MDTTTLVLQRCFVESPSEPSDAAPIEAQANQDIRRSEDNILQWMSYLPEECIRSMIAMGWDVST
jgi:hypothetical protein